MTGIHPPTADRRFDIDPATGLARSVRQVLSPWRDARPAGLAPELIVVHGISLPPGEYGSPAVDQLFCGNLCATAHPYFAEIAALRVSAHALVRRDGSVTQYVPFGQRAWHAGVSEFQGRGGCNDFSIGIELEGTDDTAYEDAQYAALAALVRSLVGTYASLSVDRIVGHSDIAPGRKTDPGLSFDWPRLRTLLAA